MNRGDHAPARTCQKALYNAGIPLTSFLAADVRKEFERMTQQGVAFTMPPTQPGPATIAVFSDTCGKLIQIFQR